jgi:protein tyrosine phosphatase (PTP) superfamily phosphohydrolase (DUF442 family)
MMQKNHDLPTPMDPLPLEPPPDLGNTVPRDPPRAPAPSFAHVPSDSGGGRPEAVGLDLVSTRVVPRRFAAGVFHGRSPTIRDLEDLARARWFRAVVSLNVEGEPDEVLSPNVEATWAHTFELRHARATFDLAHPAAAAVGRFLETMTRVDRPVYVHSHGGRRALLLLALWRAVERGRPGRDTLDELGLELPRPAAGFLVQEVDRRRLAAGRA